MTSAETESWARLRLVQGDSAAQVWELVSSAGQTTLTVGSGAGCNWIVREDGVAPIHFSLHWDGATLRIADTYGAGNVRVDGNQVGAQWRTLSGRVRIEFGKAAIVVEASSGGRSDAPHPLEPSGIPALGQPSVSAGTQPIVASGAPAQRANLKATLIGVSPLTGGAGAAPVQVSQPTVAQVAAPAAPQPTPSTDSFRPKRPGETGRPPADKHKATLVGVPGMQVPSASDSSRPAPKSGIPQGTLLGIGLSEGASVPAQQGQQQAPASSPPAASHSSKPPQKVGGASLADGDQRTIQGFPLTGGTTPPSSPAPSVHGRRVTQQGVVSESPGVQPGAVARAPVRAISSAPPPAEKVGTAWVEVPGEQSLTGEIVDAVPGAPGRPATSATAATVPQAMLSGQAQIPRSDPPRTNTPRSPAPTAAQAPRSDRFSDAPTQMRDPATIASRRPKGQFPWAYVGIAALTAVAYFAWLYLLDHL